MAQPREDVIEMQRAAEVAPDHPKVDYLRDHGDAALQFLEEHENVTFTAEEERIVLRKIDRVLIPLMLGSYTIQYMDKNVMAQSSIYDLFTSLNLKGQDYSWCSSIFYFGYLAFQPILARFLNSAPLGKFVAVTSLLWAVILLCTAGAFNFTGMMIVRFFLGVAEGGVSPAFVLLTGIWYKKNEIPLRITIWYCGNGIATILQAFIAYGIGHINTGLAVWRWFFIIFGLIGIVWGVVLWIYLPDTPLTAKFLNEREKVIAIQRLRDNRTGVSSKEFKKDQFVEALFDVRVWYAFFYCIACVVPASVIANFGSLVIKGFGYSSFETSLLNCPLGVIEDIALLLTGYITYTYPNTRCLMQFLCNIPPVIGSALVYALPQSNKVGRLMGFFITPFTNGSLPMMFALTASNISGHTKRSAATSIMFVGYCIAFIVAPQFFLSSEAPQYPTGFKTMIILFSVAAVAPGLYYGYSRWQNKRKERLVAEVGEEADVYVENEEFFDLTDKQQVHFKYVM